MSDSKTEILGWWISRVCNSRMIPRKPKHLRACKEKRPVRLLYIVNCRVSFQLAFFLFRVCCCNRSSFFPFFRDTRWFRINKEHKMGGKQRVPWHVHSKFNVLAPFVACTILGTTYVSKQTIVNDATCMHAPCEKRFPDRSDQTPRTEMNSTEVEPWFPFAMTKYTKRRKKLNMLF